MCVRWYIGDEYGGLPFSGQHDHIGVVECSRAIIRSSIHYNSAAFPSLAHVAITVRLRTHDYIRTPFAVISKCNAWIGLKP